MNEKYVPAFKEKLVISEFEKELQPFDKLHEFETDKRFVVRKLRPEFTFDDGEKVDLDRAASIFQDSLHELDSKFGIPSPTHMVMAEDEHKIPSLYILTERIEPVAYGGVGMEQTEAANGIANLFRSLIEYYEQKYATGESYMSDLPEPGQYVYGKKDQTDKPKWYLVDTDPYFGKDKGTLLEVVEALQEEVPDIEKEFATDLSDVKSRAEVLHKSLSRDLGFEE